MTLVSMKDQISESVNGTKLVHIASSDPHHLLYTILFDAIESLVERLFKLSGR